MPEGPDYETNELRETLHHAGGEHHAAGEHNPGQEHGDHGAAPEERWIRWIALSTALLAVVAALASLESGSRVNEALIAKQDAAIQQAKASDQWAYYQAKGIKSVVSGSTASLLGELAPASAQIRALRGEAARYKSDQAKISKDAKEFEAERDRQNATTDIYLEEHHTFAYSVTLLQVAIALSAIAALTRRRYIWFISLAAGAVGLLLCIRGFLSHG